MGVQALITDPKKLDRVRACVLELTNEWIQKIVTQSVNVILCIGSINDIRLNIL